jgi:hypothetical protein
LNAPTTELGRSCGRLGLSSSSRPQATPKTELCESHRRFCVYPVG